MSIKHLDVCHKLGKEKTQPRVTPLLLLGYPFPSWDPFDKQTNKQNCLFEEFFSKKYLFIIF